MSMESKPESDFSLSLGPTHPSTGHGLGDIIKRRVLVVIVVTIIIWAAATLVGLSRPKIYRASSLLLVARPQQRWSTELSTPSETWYDVQSEVPIHLRLIRRTEMAEHVRQTLKLNYSAGYLLSRVSCEQLPGASGDNNLLTLSFDDSDPQRAQQIANAWAKDYVDDVKERGVASVTAALEYVDDQLGVVGGQLAQVESSLAGRETQQQRNGVSQEALSTLIQLKGALADNETEQAAINAQLQQLSGLIGDEKRHLDTGTAGAGTASAKPKPGRAVLSPARSMHARPASGRKTGSRGAAEAALELVPPGPSAGLGSIGAGATAAAPEPQPSAGGSARTYGRPPAATQSTAGPGPVIGPPSDLAQTLGQEIAQLRARRQQMVERYYEDSPQVKAIDAQLRELQKRYSQAIGASRVVSLRDARIPLQGQLASLQARASVIQGQLAQEEQRVGLLPSARMSLDEMGRQRTVLQQVSSMLLTKQYDLQIQKAMAVPNIQALEYADVPRSPIEPKMETLSGIGLVLGLLIGLTLVIVLDQIEDTFGDVDEIQPYTGVQVLGQIARFAKQAQPGPELMEDTRSAFSRSVQMLASMLRMEMERRGISSVLLTSAGGRVGKTTITAALACALAGGGERVLIVDGDLHKRHLRRWFGLDDDGPGLASVLVGRATIEDAIVDTGVAGLRLLPAGPSPPTPADLLATDKAKELIREINASADIVIWDTPPAAFLPDAAVIAQQVGGVVYLIGGKDRRRMVRQALTSLRMVGAGLLGIVANGVRPPGGYKYYYYYYYYPYPRGSREERKKRPSAD